MNQNNPFLNKPDDEEAKNPFQKRRVNPLLDTNASGVEIGDFDVPEPIIPARTDGKLPNSPFLKRISDTVEPAVLEPAPIEEQKEVFSPQPVEKPVEKFAKKINPLFAEPEENDTAPSVAEPANLDEGIVKSKAKHKQAALASASDFDEEDSPSTIKKISKKRVKGKAYQFTERDMLLIRFLVRFQFAYANTLARLTASNPDVITNRLRVLESNGLVKRDTIASGVVVWRARQAGIEMVGLPFKESAKNVSIVSLAHTVGISNIAAELERGYADSHDLLGLVKQGLEFPPRRRFPLGIRLFGEVADETPLELGEMTISEREIRQGQMRWRGGRDSQEMREEVNAAIADPSMPELEEGNEGLFVIYGSGGKTGEHVPDLVVARGRDALGKPNHIAVELELNPKEAGEWRRILRSYREAGGMYDKLYYFTPSNQIANALRRADEEVGLGERLIIRKYVYRDSKRPFLG